MPFDATDILPRTTGLADCAYADLSAFFASVSQEQRDAMRDLLTHLERAAEGQLPAALYVSAIPAGAGKTQSLAAFARVLMASPTHVEAGMLVLVNRRAEAEDMAKKELQGFNDRLCIYTSDPKVNELGAHATADAAQVCIATQAALKATLRGLEGAPFADAKRFHYHGQRRLVICWDESFAFNRPATLNADTIGALATALRRQSDEAARVLKRWSSDLDEYPDDVCAVPDFKALGIDFRLLEDDAGDDDLVTQAKALCVLSGARGFITRQGKAPVLVTHYPEIPDSLLPVVVTDASAKLNQSYTQMATTKPLVWLKDAPKTYRNLTVRLVPVAASRSVYRDTQTTRGRDLIEMAVRYVEGVKGDVLVIGYKGRFALRGMAQTTIEAAIKARLKATDAPRFRWLHFGQHTSTNEFRNCKHVLLLGLNFLPRAAGHAASGAALNLDLIDNHPTDCQIRAMRLGMLMDSTLQALLRGHARVSVGADCGAMEAVICQTSQTGLTPDDYLRMFPSATVVDDAVLMPPKPLHGRLGELDAIVVRRLDAGDREMTNVRLYEELGMPQGNFLRLVKRPEWQARIAQLGLNPQKLGVRAMGLRQVA